MITITSRPGVLAAEIIEDLQAALEELVAIKEELDAKNASGMEATRGRRAR
jgi:hypothetical protein